MTPYRIVDRLTEPTSWIGVVIALIAYAVPLLITPDIWIHVGACLQTVLGTALFFLPENRAIVTGEAILKAVAAALPSAYATPANTPPASVGFGEATLSSTSKPPAIGAAGPQAGFVSLNMLPFACLFGFSLLILLLLTNCTGTAPTQQQVQSAQTISSDLACFSQATANATTSAFQAAGDAKNAAISSVASAAVGALCTGLPVGTQLKPASSSTS